MSYSYGKFDKSGDFFATSTSKLGKKEIHIYPIQNDSNNEYTISNSLSNSFELDQDDDIVSFDWIYKDSITNGKSKRRASNVTTKKHSTTSTYLAISLKSGKILIYSPFQKHVVNELQNSVEIKSLASANNTFWVSGANEAIEFELNDSNPKKSIKLPSKLKNLNKLYSFQFNNEDYLAIGGDKFIVLKNGDNKKTFIDLPITKSYINSISSSSKYIAYSLDNQTSIHIIDLITKKPYKVLNTTTSIETISFIDQSSIYAITTSGQVEIFTNITNGSIKPSLISLNNKDVAIVDAIHKDDQIIVSWIDLEPTFEAYDLKDLQNGKTIKINVKHVSKQQNAINTTTLEPITVEIESLEEYNVDEAELVTLIKQKLENPVELLQVLVSNEDVEKIQYVVSHIEFETVSKLYDVVSTRIENDPTESSILNNWLKWIFITHGNKLQSSSNLKSLKNSLSKNLKTLPNLLALQGRLELLQSQLELRNQVSKEGIVTDLEINGLDDDLVSKAEESITYVNGENDDEGDVIGSAGNSDVDDGEEEDDDEEEDEDADEVRDVDEDEEDGSVEES